MERSCSRANKLSYIDTIRGALRKIAIKEREMYYNQNHPVYHILTIPLLLESSSLRTVFRYQKDLIYLAEVQPGMLRYVDTIRGTVRDIAIKEREIRYIKIKIIPFIMYFSRNYTINFR